MKKQELINRLFPNKETLCQQWLGVSSRRMRQLKEEPSQLNRKQLDSIQKEIDFLQRLLNEINRDSL